MGEYAQQRFVFLSSLSSRSKRRPEKPLVPGDSTFNLPTLPINAMRKFAMHLRAVVACRSLVQAAAGIELDDCGTNTKFLARKPMIVFAVVTAIAKDLVQV